MKKGVSHIFQKTVVTVLLAGFIAHLALPFSSKAQKTAFTQWLDHNVVSTGDNNEIRLRNTIRQLPEQTSDFSVLLEKASELIANNKDEFRIQPFAPAGDQNEVTSWLVGQWNVFQHQKAENNAILHDRIKNLPNWTFSNNTTAGFLSRPSLAEFFFLEKIAAVTPENPVKNISPLISGISINAP